MEHFSKRRVKFVNSPADDDRENYHDHEEEHKGAADDDDGHVSLRHQCGDRPRHLDVALVAQAGNVPGLAGELPLHSLSDLKLGGRIEDCGCKREIIV